jgi:hypothetical protein
MILSDHLVFGCIAAVLGTVVGVVAAVVFLMFGAAHGLGFDVRVVFFSTLYFFAVGFLRGAAAGEVFGEGTAYFVSFLAAAGKVAVDARTSSRTGTSRASSGWIIVLYLAGLALLAVFG